MVQVLKITYKEKLMKSEMLWSTEKKMRGYDSVFKALKKC